MPGPAPEHPTRRRRRNTGQQFERLPPEGRRGRAPALPNPPGRKLRKITREWWRAFWRSPMATKVAESDHHELVRLAWLKDEFFGGDRDHLAEIRQLEDRFGGYPLARRKLYWEIGREEAPEPQRAPRVEGDPRERFEVIAGGK